MKQINIVLLIFPLFVVLICFHSDARLLAAEQAVEEKANIDHKETMHEESYIGIKDDDLLDLMGSKRCDEKDEDCLKRRMIAEAHLDYIYTQQHKP
ncbi:Phytosulfokine [Trema orientale]|uniref:Phytosulfokine n=1 Tax=Trema orientale TaxID=63057 RepID=A0A2P5BVX7_TREOI|nr:Phytosulfokine [Trema orientale]